MESEALDGHRFAFGYELVDFGLGKAAGIGELGVHLAVLVKLRQVRRRGNEEGDKGPTLARLAQLDEFHSVRGLGEHLVVLVQPVPSLELAVGAHRVAEIGFGRGHGPRPLSLDGGRECGCAGEAEDKDANAAEAKEGGWRVHAADVSTRPAGRWRRNSGKGP